MATELKGAPAPSVPVRSDALIRNAGWLLFDRGFRFLLVFATSVVVLRHLGPENAGRLGNALALAAILAGLCDLGLDPIIRIEVLHRPEQRGATLATAAALRLLVVPFAWVAYALLLARNPADVRDSGLLLGIGLTLASPAVLTLDSWFQSQTQAHYAVWGQNGGLLAGAALRWLGVALGASLAWFGWTAALELAVGALLLLRFYHTAAAPQTARFASTTARALLRQSWPIALTNIAILVYTRVDIVLLSWWQGEHETGIYSAALRIAELGYIMPMILVNTFFPRLAELRRESENRFEQLIRRLLIAATWGGLATALTFSLGAPLVIRLLYGTAYAGSAAVLALSAWNAVFAGLGAVRAQWLVLQNLQRHGLYYVTMGAGLNLGLNAVMIPRFGAIGAAASSLATQAFILLVAPLFFAPTRRSVTLLVQSFVFAGWRTPPTPSSPSCRN